MATVRAGGDRWMLAMARAVRPQDDRRRDTHRETHDRTTRLGPQGAPASRRGTRMEVPLPLATRPWGSRLWGPTCRNASSFFIVMHPRSPLRVGVTDGLSLEVPAMLSEFADGRPMARSRVPFFWLKTRVKSREHASFAKQTRDAVTPVSQGSVRSASAGRCFSGPDVRSRRASSRGTVAACGGLRLTWWRRAPLPLGPPATPGQTRCPRPPSARTT